MGGVGFEPTKGEAQQIYSLPPLAAWVPAHISRAGGRTRTANLLITNQPLCQLSYAGWVKILKERRAGEPPEEKIT